MLKKLQDLGPSTNQEYNEQSLWIVHADEWNSMTIPFTPVTLTKATYHISVGSMCSHLHFLIDN